MYKLVSIYLFFLLYLVLLSVCLAQGKRFNNKYFLGNGVYIGGIPVPGRRVPAMRSIELYLSTCKPTTPQTGFILEKLNKVKFN